MTDEDDKRKFGRSFITPGRTDVRQVVGREIMKIELKAKNVKKWKL